jgi:DNA-binding NarL/FixJ family response regulator
MIRTVLFTDQPILAQALAAILSPQAGCDVRGICTTIAGLQQAVLNEEPDVLLMDLTPEVSYAVISDLRRAAPDCKIVLRTSSISTELGLQAITLGIRGILRTTLPAELIVKCICKVSQGELWFEKALTDSFLTAQRIPLTRREGQLIALLSQGLKNKEIAAALMITEGTVKVYMSKLFQKLGVKDRFELALYGLKNLTAGQGHAESPAGLASSSTAFQTRPLRSLVLSRPKPASPGTAISSVAN